MAAMPGKDGSIFAWFDFVTKSNYLRLRTAGRMTNNLVLYIP